MKDSVRVLATAELVEHMSLNPFTVMRQEAQRQWAEAGRTVKLEDIVVVSVRSIYILNSDSYAYSFHCELKGKGNG